jgi:hypothetical protein
MMHESHNEQTFRKREVFPLFFLLIRYLFLNLGNIFKTLIPMYTTIALFLRAIVRCSVLMLRYVP